MWYPLFGFLVAAAVMAFWLYRLGCDATRCSCDRPECGGGCPHD